MQYASATGTGNFGFNATNLTPLSSVLQPGQYLLIRGVQGNGGTTPLPQPDIVDTTPLDISATGAKVALVNSTGALGCGGSTPCSSTQRALIEDLVGWGDANFFEVTPGPATSNTTALIRRNGGCTDTDYNGADFTTGPPVPRNTASPRRLCGSPEPEPQLSVALALNRETVRPGEVVQISVTAANPGASVVADVYLMAALPPAAGSQFGCPDEDAVVFAADGGTRLVLACASDPADTFPPYFDNLAILAGLNVAVPNFFSLVWPPGAPPGPYTIEIFATPAGALADGVLGDEDIVGSAFDTLTFVP